MKPRSPHAIHKLRARMNAVSRRAAQAAARAEDAQRFVAESLDAGGLYHCEAQALKDLGAVITDLRAIAIEAACVEHEPGHTVRRPANDAQPALLEETGLRQRRSAASPGR